MKRILLTGGTGFVGSNLVRRALAEGHEVHLLVRPAARFTRLEDVLPSLRVHVAPLEDRASVAALLSEVSPEWIFHLAAFGAYSSQQDAEEIVRTNLLGTIHLIEAAAAARIAAFVNAGSSSEYGYTDHPPSEEEPLAPNSTYAVTKAAATLYGRNVARTRGLPVVTLRLYSVYGPYEDEGRLIPTLLRAGSHGRLPPLVRPTVARDFVHVDDVCDAFFLAAAAAESLARGAIFNVGTGIQTSIRDVVEIVRRILPITEQPRWGSMADRQWDTDCWVSDPRLIRAVLGWKPRYDLEVGLRSTLQWMRSGRHGPVIDSIPS